jgi:hypothetical protein
MKKGDITNGSTIVHVALQLHKQFGSYSNKGASELALAIDKLFHELE